MRVIDVAPTVAFAAQFAGDDPFHGISFHAGSLHASTGYHGVVCSSPFVGLDGVTVPAKHFSKTLSALQDSYEEFDVRVTEHRVIVTAGKYRSEIPRIVSPVTPRDAVSTYQPLGPDFWSAVDAVGPTVGHTFPGVWWSGTRVVSTDNARITRAAAPPCPLAEGALLPHEFLKFVRGGMDRCFVDSAGVLWLSNAGGALAWTSLLDLKFPYAAVEQIFGMFSDSWAGSGTEVDLENRFADVVARLLLSSRSPVSRVMVTLSEGEMSFDVPETEGFSAQESVPTLVRGPGVSVAVNGRFLEYALRTFSTMRVLESKKPVYFRGGDVEHIMAPLFA